MGEEITIKPSASPNSPIKANDAGLSYDDSIRALSRRTLALTFRYQKRFPEIVNGKRLIGRMRLDKKVEFFLDLSKLAIPEEQIRSSVISWYGSSSSLPDGERKILRREKVNAIADYCLRKNGSVDGAVAELTGLRKKMALEEAPIGEPPLKADCLRLAKLQRLPEKEALDLYDQLTHSIWCSLGLLTVMLDLVVDALEERKLASWQERTQTLLGSGVIQNNSQDAGSA